VETVEVWVRPKVTKVAKIAKITDRILIDKFDYFIS
jgi:hypothetical protein